MSCAASHDFVYTDASTVMTPYRTRYLFLNTSSFGGWEMRPWLTFPSSFCAQRTFRSLTCFAKSDLSFMVALLLQT